MRNFFINKSGISLIRNEPFRKSDTAIQVEVEFMSGRQLTLSITVKDFDKFKSLIADSKVGIITLTEVEGTGTYNLE